jgi:hypothetical protein
LFTSPESECCNAREGAGKTPCVLGLILRSDWNVVNTSIRRRRMILAAVLEWRAQWLSGEWASVNTSCDGVETRVVG